MDTLPAPSPAPRRRRWLLITLAALLLLPPVALTLAWLTLDTETLKPRITTAVEAATGRALALNGPITLRLALIPTIAIDDIALANIPGGSAPEMLTAKRVELELALLPLFSRQIDIRRLALIEPRVLLETNAEGRANWAFSRPTPASGSAPPAPPAAPSREAAPRTGLDIRSFTITQGLVTWRDPVHAHTRLLSIESLSLDATATGLRHRARLALGGTPLVVEGETGPLAALLATTPTPYDVTLRAGGGEARLVGTLPAANTPLALTLRIPDLAALSGLAGHTLPRWRDISASTSLTLPSATRATLRDLRASGPSFDLAGDLDLTLAPRPGLAGTLAFQRLDLTIPASHSAGAGPGASAAANAAPPSGQPAPVAPRRVIPDTALPFRALRAADADLRLSIAELRATPSFTLTGVTARVLLANGVLAIDPLTLTLPGGAVAADLSADATATPPSLRLALRTPADGLDLSPLQAALGAERYVSGQLQTAIALAASGADTRSLAASLEGSLSLALANGRLAPRALAGIPPELLRILLPQGFPAEGLALQCVALRAPARAGTLRLETFLAQSDLGRLGATGTINLATEALDIRLLPDLRSGIFTLRAPVNLSGTLAAPRVARMDAASAAAAGLTAFLGTQRTPDRTLEALADTLAHGTPTLTDCATALAVARGERPPPAANTVTTPPPAPRTPNPGEVLRGLFGAPRR